MRHADIDIERLKQNADLFGRICRHTSLRKAGRVYSGKCPFPDHEDRNASFVFDPETNRYHCYSTACGRSGTIIDWLMDFGGCKNFLDAVEVLGGKRAVQNAKITDADAGRLAHMRAVRQTNIIAAQTKSRTAGYKIFSQGKELNGTVAEVYLREARGIGDVALPGTVLRYAPNLPFWAEVEREQFEIVHRGPALLAAFQRPDGRFAAVHQTWLEADGSGKAVIKLPDGLLLPSKKIRGPFMGTAIRLAPPAPIMALGEGIETCLSALSCGLCAWVAGTKGNLVGAGLADGIREPHPNRIGHMLPTIQPDLASHRAYLPPECHSEIILADSDTKDLDTLKAELERAVVRAGFEGRAAHILWPPLGMDMNDWLRT